MHSTRWAVTFWATLGLVLTACSTSSDANATTEPAVDTTNTPDVVTTIRQVPSDDLASMGQVTIGETRYEFAFECFTSGEGEVLALGVGQEPGSEVGTQAVVQAFAGQPYVSVVVGADRVLELAIDAPVELFVQSSVISGSALRFVDSADEVGVGDPLGLGAVNVSCESFAPGLPAGYSPS